MSNEIKMSEGLKPCPFCGGKAELDWGSTYNVSEGMRQDGWVECLSCEATVEIASIEDSHSSDDLIKKWNNRTTDDRITKLEAEKAELIEFVKSLQLDVSNEIKLEQLLERRND